MLAAEVEEQARVEALEDLDVLDTPREERFDRITRLATRLLGVEMAAVNLVAADRQWTKSVVGVDLDELPREQSFCSVAIRDDDVLVVEDTHTDERFRSNPLVTGAPHLRFYAGQPLHAPGGERVGALCVLGASPHSLSDDELALLRELATWVEEELAADEELQRAGAVQRGLLPRTSPDLPGYDLAGRCVPSRHVGGDLYDWYVLDDRLAVTVADVMGKGVPAAIMGASLRAVLRAATRTADLATAVQLGAESMESDFADAAAFATVFHASLAGDTGEVEYVDAGHGLAFVVRADGEVERTLAGGLPAGAVPGSAWSVASVRLDPGDALVVASDGLLDLHPDRAAVEAAVRESVRAGSAQDAVDRLTAPGDRAARLDDDLTVVVLCRERAGAPRSEQEGQQQ